MTAGNFNNRQTGARKFEAHPEEVDRDRAGLAAAENRPSRLMRDVDETVEGARQSDGVDQRPMPPKAGRKKRASPPRGSRRSPSDDR